MKKFVVIGLSNFGFNMAKALFRNGNEVIAIDMDRSLIQDIDEFCSEAIVMNATDKDKLRTLGLETMDGVIVATGSKISISILICLYLNEIGVKNIIAKALDEDHEKILRKVGATEIINPEKDMAIRVAKSLSKPNIMDLIPLSDDFDIVQVAPPSEFIGKSIKDLDLRAKYNVYVIAIKQLIPEAFIPMPSPDFIIKDSDILMIIGKSDDINRIKALV